MMTRCAAAGGGLLAGVARQLTARLLRKVLMAVAAGAVTMIVGRLLRTAPGTAQCPVHGLRYDASRETCPAC
jgi:hypothetical protein